MRTMSVLLVDDDQDTCKMFKMVLDHYHWPLTTLETAESALNFLQSQSPDVIVLDIFLPSLDGYQTFAQIRKQGLAPESCILATTAYYTADTRQEVQDFGFAGFLPKPLNAAELVRYIQQLADRRSMS